MKNYTLGIIILIVVISGGILAYKLMPINSPAIETSSPPETNTSSTTPIQGSDKSYTLSDIAQHATPASCWLAVDGMVYDVTSYINQHPGGMEIVEGCGKDATEMINSVREHAQEGRAVLPQFKIGTLAN